jgi:hypothetical protein
VDMADARGTQRIKIAATVIDISATEASTKRTNRIASAMSSGRLMEGM